MIRPVVCCLIYLILCLGAVAQPCTQQVIASFSPTPTCTGRPLTLSATTIAGASYSWSGPSSVSANTQNFTITNTNVTHNGDYIVTATVGSCVYKDTVNINVDFSPTKPVVYAPTSFCTGDTLRLTALWNAGSYGTIWWGPFGTLGPLPNLNNVYMKPNLQYADTGVYYAAGISHQGCISDSTIIHIDSIASKPAIPVITGATAYCEGATIQFNWSSITPGVFYSWQASLAAAQVGPLSGQSITIPNATMAKQGRYYFMVSFKGCTVKDSLDVHINPSSPPGIVITASPDTNVLTNTSVTFSGGVSNWHQGAASHVWSVNSAVMSWGPAVGSIPDLIIPSPQDGDNICLWVKVDSTCAAVNTGFTCVTMEVSPPASVKTAEGKSFSIYPNPNNGAFIINSGREGTLDITNHFGQLCYTSTIVKGCNKIELAGKFSDGIYILKIQSGTETQTTKLTIRH